MVVCVLHAVYLRLFWCWTWNGRMVVRDAWHLAPIQAGQHCRVEPFRAQVSGAILQPSGAWLQLQTQREASEHRHVLHLPSLGTAEHRGGDAGRHRHSTAAAQQAAGAGLPSIAAGLAVLHDPCGEWSSVSSCRFSLLCISRHARCAFIFFPRWHVQRININATCNA